jgi:hypothetical protein
LDAGLKTSFCTETPPAGTGVFPTGGLVAASAPAPPHAATNISVIEIQTFLNIRNLPSNLSIRSHAIEQRDAYQPNLHFTAVNDTKRTVSD